MSLSLDFLTSKLEIFLLDILKRKIDKIFVYDSHTEQTSKTVKQKLKLVNHRTLKHTQNSQIPNLKVKMHQKWNSFVLFYLYKQNNPMRKLKLIEIRRMDSKQDFCKISLIICKPKKKNRLELQSLKSLSLK